MPRPQLENPIPVRYWPKAMPSLPSGLFSTASLRLRAITSMAFKLNMSVISQAPFVV